MKLIHVRIVTPKGCYKEFDTPILNVKTVDGERGILPNHMPIVTMLDIGKMVTEELNERNTYAVAGGLLYFRDNLAEILTDAIENQRDIDEGRAEAAKERALKRIEKNDEGIDLKRAEIALKKAVNRLNIKGN